MSTAWERLAALIKTEQDVSRIDVLKQDLQKDQKAISLQLERETQLLKDRGIEGMEDLGKSLKALQNLRANLQKIDRLKDESFTSIDRYNVIADATDAYEVLHEAQSVYDTFKDMNEVSSRLNSLIDSINSGESESGDLMRVHYHLTYLRDFHDRMAVLAQRSTNDVKNTVQKLDIMIKPFVEKFDGLLEIVATDLISFIAEGDFTVVIQMIKLIDYEEREDLKIQAALSVAQNKTGVSDNKLLFSSIGRRVPRGYKDKFMQWVSESVSDRFATIRDQYFEKEPAVEVFGMLQGLDWIAEDLETLKAAQPRIFPERWDFWQTLFKWYMDNLAKLMDELIELEPETSIVFDILQFDKDFRAQLCSQLDIPKSSIMTVIGEEAKARLLDDCERLLVEKMNEWFSTRLEKEQQMFVSRSLPPDTDAEGYTTIQDSNVVFKMFQQQIDVAIGSAQGKILFGVIENFCRLVSSSREKWRLVVDDQLEGLTHFTNAPETEQESMSFPGGIVEYLVALSNDQTRSAAYMETLTSKVMPMVSSKYRDMIHVTVDKAMDECVNFSHVCIQSLVNIFFSDVKLAVESIFTKEWYSNGLKLVTNIVDTFEEYLHDFDTFLFSYMARILWESLMDKTLRGYLQCLKRDRKFRVPKVFDCIKRDVGILYTFFFKVYPNEVVVQDKLIILQHLMEFIEYQEDEDFLLLWEQDCLPQFNDLPVSFLEAILRSRDDFDEARIPALLSKIQECNDKFVQDLLISGQPIQHTFMKDF